MDKKNKELTTPPQASQERDDNEAVCSAAVRSAARKTMAENQRLREALSFYARHIHWMEVAEGSEALTLLVAAKGDCMDGWAVAEDALAVNVARLFAFIDKPAASPPSSAAEPDRFGVASPFDHTKHPVVRPDSHGVAGAAEQAKPDECRCHEGNGARDCRIHTQADFDAQAEQAQAGESSCGPAASLSNETLVEVAGFASGLSHYRLNVGPDRGGVR